jgi:hypothetical protein
MLDFMVDSLDQIRVPYDGRLWILYISSSNFLRNLIIDFKTASVKMFSYFCPFSRKMLFQLSIFRNFSGEGGKRARRPSCGDTPVLSN